MDGRRFLTCFIAAVFIRVAFARTQDTSSAETEPPTECVAPNIKNGKHIGDNYTIDAKVTVICNNGYNTSNPNITCQKTGTWSGNTACERIICGAPNITNGNYTGDNFTMDAKVTVICNNGYKTSNPNIICQKTGTWSGNTACKRIECPAPNIKNGKHTGDNYTMDANVTVICNYGYNTSNQNITCQNNETWSGNTACQRIECRAPDITNGKHTGDNYTMDANVYITCNNGYTKPENPTITCQENGTWSDYTACKLIDCGTPSFISGGYISKFNSSNLNGMAEITCFPGYNQTGGKTIACQKSGYWSNQPTCEIISCAVPVLGNGTVNIETQVHANSTVTFTCNSGFSMEGNSTALCNITGKFDSIPTCALISVPYKKTCNVSIQCQTLNAECLDFHCVCPLQHDFYLETNNSCHKRPALGNNFKLEIIKEQNDSLEIFASLSVQTSSNGVQLYAKLKNDSMEQTDYFNFTNGTTIICFDKLTPAKRYNIAACLSKDGVPSNECNTIAVVTAPNCGNNWSITSVSENWFSFHQNSTFDSFDFNVIEMSNLATFKVNKRFCNQTQPCAFPKNVSELNVTDLVSGSQYGFLFKTAMGKESNTGYALSSTACQTFIKYTVPEIPVIEIPNATITSSSFTVQFATNSTKMFLDWRVDVHNTTDFVTTLTHSNANSTMNISENIEPATTYNVSVVTLVMGQTSSPRYWTINTRPLDSSPALLGNVSTNTITLSFNPVQFNVSFTHIIVRVNYSNAEFNGPCNKTVMNCTFVKPTNKSELKISNLKPGASYNIFIFTAFGGMESKEPQTILSYTAPNSISKETVKIIQKTTSSLNTTWTSVNGTISGYIVMFTCQSPNVNTPKPIPNSNLTVNEATVKNLDPGTFCNISVQTFLINGKYGILYGDVVTKDLPESTNETAPGKVTSPMSTHITSNSTTLQWFPPSIRNGILRFYIAWINDSNDTCVQSAVWKCYSCSDLSPPTNPACEVVNTYNISSEEPLSWSIKNLHPFRNYTVYIAAFTSFIGLLANVHIDTLGDSKPIGLRYTEVSANFIDLDWLPPYERNGIVMNYSVRYTYHERKCRGVGNITETTILTNTNEKNITDNIYPFWTYNIAVQATNKIGTGDYSDVLVVQTNESNPSGVYTTNSRAVHARNATIQWMDPCYANGILKRFYVELLNSSSVDFMNETWVSTVETNASTHEHFLNDLLPFRNYSVRVKAATNAGNGTYDISLNFTTKIDVPIAPSGLRQGKTESSFVRIHWKSTMELTGPTKYIISVTDVSDNSQLKSYVTTEGWWNDQLATYADLFELDAYWNYSIAVTAETSYGNQGPLRSKSSTVIVQTAESVPGRLQSLSAVSEQDVTKPPMLYLKWQAPKERDLNGIIVRYEIYCSNGKQQINVTASTLSHTIPIYIDNKSNVTVEVRAATSVGHGEPFIVTVEVKPGAPEVPPETPSNPLTKKAQVPVADDKKMIAVQLSKTFLCNNKTGTPVQWGIIIAQESKATDLSFVGSRGEYQSRKNTLYKKWSEVKDMDDIPPYLATGPNWSPSCPKGGNKRRRRAAVAEIEPLNFIIGIEDCSNNQEYCNGPLQAGRAYKVKSFACTTSGCTETLYSQPIRTASASDQTAAIIGGVVTTVVIIAIVGSVVYMKRTNKVCFKYKVDKHGLSGEHIYLNDIDSNVVFRPSRVKLAEFPALVDRMHERNDLLFGRAFEMLNKNSSTHPAVTALSDNNRAKNRFLDILPFDHSRVKLRPTEEESDYINANHIPGPNSRGDYIATQSPMQTTIDDFWRMIWEHNVDTIVMLEMCERYWPDKNHPIYCNCGEMVVSLLSEKDNSFYKLCVFEIKRKKERRRINHFWFSKWPDVGCLKNPTVFLDFVKVVRQSSGTGGPFISHCSDGAGRTGVYFAVDHLLQRIRDHDEVDIFQLILEMREHRCNMVQTKDQFMFIYECVKEYITFEIADGHQNLYQNTRVAVDHSEHPYEKLNFRKN